jgi:phosphoglycolate phosphatase-like HAD superfamily hydrolase
MKYDHSHDFSGRQIRNHRISVAYDNQNGNRQLIKSILDEFALELKMEFSRNTKPFLLKGVDTIVTRLAKLKDAYLGLVTGNIAEGARIKLESVGLHSFFPVGGFGDDSKYRNKLPPIAISRAEAYYETTFMKKDIWIIGDSVYDIACASNNGLRCLAVASGKTDYSRLEAVRPEFLEQDLSDADKILDILLNK